MKVIDICNRAIIRSGVVSSFNPDEIPEDMQQRVSDILRNELIMDINCDRSLDITENAVNFEPRGGRVDLVSTPQDYDKFVLPPCRFTEQELYEARQVGVAPGQAAWCLVNVFQVLRERGLVSGTPSIYEYTEFWPTDSIGMARRPVALWSSDYRLLEIENVGSIIAPDKDFDLTAEGFNVPWDVAYVSGVYRKSDGAEFKYRTEGELVSAMYRDDQLAYTFEDNITHKRVKFSRGFSDTPVTIILPVPVKIINSYSEPNPWEGTIVAPAKFRSFLILALAWRFASESGVDTKDELKVFVDAAYANLLRNRTKQTSKQDVNKKMAEYLGRRPGACNGGYNG